MPEGSWFKGMSASRRIRRAEDRRRARSLVHESMDAQLRANGDDSGQGGAAESSWEPEAARPELVGLGEGQVLPRLLRTSDVAGMFRVHGKTVERWRKLDGLPCLRIRGTVRYDLSDVLRWASARKEGV